MKRPNVQVASTTLRRFSGSCHLAYGGAICEVSRQRLHPTNRRPAPRAFPQARSSVTLRVPEIFIQAVATSISSLVVFFFSTLNWQQKIKIYVQPWLKNSTSLTMRYVSKSLHVNCLGCRFHFCCYNASSLSKALQPSRNHTTVSRRTSCKSLGF